MEVPYNWYICYVTLENKNLSHLPLELMGEEELARYALYMSSPVSYTHLDVYKRQHLRWLRHNGGGRPQHKPPLYLF